MGADPFDSELPAFLTGWLTAQGWRPANAIRAGWDPERRSGVPTAQVIGWAHRALLDPADTVALVISAGQLRRTAGAEVRALRPSVVLDTSGCYLPGIGTPTLVLVCPPPARPLLSLPPTVTRVARGLKGEPSTPAAPEQGQAWRELQHCWQRCGWRGGYFDVHEVPTPQWWTASSPTMRRRTTSMRC